jgi:hypothetical protein
LGSVSPIPDVTGLDEDEAVDVIKEWFLSNFEDPAQSTPRNDGEFQYIWGGPYDARDEIGNAFSESVPEQIIEAAIRAVEAEGIDDWAPHSNRPQPDYDEQPDRGAMFGATPTPPPNPPGTFLTGSIATVSARAELTVRPEPVMITPTPYPDDPASAFIVHGYLQVDRRSEEFRALNTKLDTVLEELRKSNEISGVLREQLVSEIEAGRRILESPRPDRGLVKVLLVHSLRWIIAAAGGGIVGTHADEALSMLMQFLHHVPPIPI